eukprot:TRINITY_DN4118_c0_g1_i1.p1 TRINITY_DN4118_c0_g1~~TRINITY_DN4118_c0_g1_i1.p1  ORF type:complete len:464 (+),score=107.46 TRINITY_DN4118_c0_g1_i1:833-2224(+)
MEGREPTGLPATGPAGSSSNNSSNSSSGTSVMSGSSSGLQQLPSSSITSTPVPPSTASATTPVTLTSASTQPQPVPVSATSNTPQLPSVVTAATQVPTLVTATAVLGAKSVNITSDEKPSINDNINSNSNNNFPPSNPANAVAAGGSVTPIQASQAPGSMGMNMSINMSMNRAMGMSGGTPDSFKKKRGRPRKYGADSSMALALAPISSHQGLFSPLQKRGRGRPPGSGRKQRLAALGEWVLGSAGIGFTPHVITIAAGEDVASKIMSFSQQGPRAVCVLSANGAISNVTLRQPATSGGTLTYEGRFEILSLSGSFLLNENGGTRSRTGGLSVSLASPDGRVIGGGVAGMLMAASPVQVVVGSFISNSQKEFHRQVNPEPSVGLSQVASPTNAIPVSRASLHDTYGGPGSPPLNQNSGGVYASNTNLQTNHNMTSFQSMAWTGLQSMREARHNTDINISLPEG